MRFNMETLSKLLCSARNIETEKGDLSGQCVFCGLDTIEGHEAKLKVTFTAYDLIQGGSCICPECWHVYNEQMYRKKAWVVTPSEFTEVKRDAAKELLLNPPEPPFVIYLTQSWKKQGWINLINRVQHSKSNYTIGLDYDLVEVSTEKLRDYCELITELLEKKMTKTELSTGQFKAKSYEKLGYDIVLMEKIKTLAGNNLWNLAIFVS
jgi:CRISPR type IV-associated protein Csf1